MQICLCFIGPQKINFALTTFEVGRPATAQVTTEVHSDGTDSYIIFNLQDFANPWLYHNTISIASTSYEYPSNLTLEENYDEVRMKVSVSKRFEEKKKFVQIFDLEFLVSLIL